MTFEGRTRAKRHPSQPTNHNHRPTIITQQPITPSTTQPSLNHHPTIAPSHSTQQPVVERFLDEVRAHGAYRGYCSLGIVFQTLENAGLRRSLGMGGGMSGVLVNRVQPTSPAAAALRKGDVLLAFDGVPIANDGTVHFRQRERIFFTSLITQKPTGAAARLRVLRAGEAFEFDVPLQPLQTLVPICKYDEVPSFLVYAGLCFVPLSQVIARVVVVVVVMVMIMAAAAV